MLYTLTVGQYQMLNEIDEDLSMIEQNIYAVAALKNMTYEEASQIRMKDFASIIDDVEGIDIRQLEKRKINSSIKLNGIDFHIEHRPDKLTSGQILDIINIRSKHTGESIAVMDLIMAAICRPKDGEYGGDKMTLHERAKYCRDVKVADVWNVFVFFWNLWNNYLNDSEDSLKTWMEETPRKAMEILDNGGDSSAS